MKQLQEVFRSTLPNTVVTLITLQSCVKVWTEMFKSNLHVKLGVMDRGKPYWHHASLSVGNTQSNRQASIFLNATPRCSLNLPRIEEHLDHTPRVNTVLVRLFSKGAHCACCICILGLYIQNKLLLYYGIPLFCSPKFITHWVWLAVIVCFGITERKGEFYSHKNKMRV